MTMETPIRIAYQCLASEPLVLVHAIVFHDGAQRLRGANEGILRDVLRRARGGYSIKGGVAQNGSFTMENTKIPSKMDDQLTVCY